MALTSAITSRGTLSSRMVEIASWSGFTPGGSHTPEIVVDAPCRAGRESLARERPDEPAEIGEVLLRIAIHPARNRVCREGQDHNANQSLHIRRSGDSDVAVVHYHAAVP
jgi:hypothetical protein